MWKKKGEEDRADFGFELDWKRANAGRERWGGAGRWASAAASGHHGEGGM